MIGWIIALAFKLSIFDCWDEHFPFVTAEEDCFFDFVRRVTNSNAFWFDCDLNRRHRVVFWPWRLSEVGVFNWERFHFVCTGSGWSGLIWSIMYGSTKLSVSQILHYFSTSSKTDEFIFKVVYTIVELSGSIGLSGWLPIIQVRLVDVNVKCWIKSESIFRRYFNQ